MLDKAPLPIGYKIHFHTSMQIANIDNPEIKMIKKGIEID